MQLTKAPVLRRASYVCLLIGFAVAVEYLVGWRSILSSWAATDPLRLLVAMALMGCTYGIRTVRLYRYFDARRNFATWARLFAQHNLILNAMPMRSGELAFPVLMNRYFQIPASRSVPALIWLRMLDLHALILIALLFLAWKLSAAAVLPAALIWLALPPLLTRVAKKLGVLLGNRRGRIAAICRAGLAAVPRSGAQSAESWGWTMLSWAVKLGVLGWILSIFSSATFLTGLLGAVGGEVSSTLPLHGPAGVGTYEAGVVAAMLPFGIPVSEAVAGGVNLHLFVLSVSILSGLASLGGKSVAVSVAGHQSTRQPSTVKPAVTSSMSREPGFLQTKRSAKL